MFRKINLAPRKGFKSPYLNYRLRQARIEARYTIKEIADHVGINYQMMFKYETLRGFPTPEIAGRIAEFLGKEVEYFFSERYREIVNEVREERVLKELRMERIIEMHIRKARKIPIFENLGFRVNSVESKQNFFGYGDVPLDEKIVDCATYMELQKKIDQVLETLTRREKEIIKLRFGMGDGYTYTLEEVGRIFNLTRERVRMIEAKGIRKLQHPVRARHLVEFLDESFADSWKEENEIIRS